MNPDRFENIQCGNNYLYCHCDYCKSKRWAEYFEINAATNAKEVQGERVDNQVRRLENKDGS